MAAPSNKSGYVKPSILVDDADNVIPVVDDAAFTAGTNGVLPLAGVYQSTVDEVDAGDAGALRMTARRVLQSAIDWRQTTISYSGGNADDIQFSTSYNSGYSAITPASLAHATWTDPTYYRIPMGIAGWRKISVGIANYSDAIATVTMFPWLNGASTWNWDATAYAIYTDTQPNNTHRYFVPEDGHATAGASVIYIPQLAIPMQYLVLKIAATTVADGFAIITSRST